MPHRRERNNEEEGGQRPLTIRGRSSGEKRRNETGGDLFDRVAGELFELRFIHVRDGMGGGDDGVILPEEGLGLKLARPEKIPRHDRRRRNPPPFEKSRVVQTARCAASSVGEAFDDGVAPPGDFFGQLRGRGLGVGRLLEIDRLADAVVTL